MLTARAMAILAREVTGTSQTSGCELDWLTTRGVICALVLGAQVSAAFNAPIMDASMCAEWLSAEMA